MRGILRALTYDLRDHRFDATIRRAQREVVPLSQDRIEKMLGRYRERFIKYRAEVIARTESSAGGPRRESRGVSPGCRGRASGGDGACADVGSGSG